jgi:membrane protease YdiL (CAAX protease family)
MTFKGAEIRIDYVSFLLMVFVMPLLVAIYIMSLNPGNVILQYMLLIPAFVYAVYLGFFPAPSAEILLPVAVGVVGIYSLLLVLNFFGVFAIEDTLVLLAPITEEAFFRGFLLNIQLSSIPKNPVFLILAFVLNATLFSLMHVVTALTFGTNVMMWYLAVVWVTGMICCIVGYMTKTLLAPIMVHMIINLFAFLGGGG